MKIEFEYTKKDWRAEIFDIEIIIFVNELGRFEVGVSDEDNSESVCVNSMAEAKQASIVLVKELLNPRIAKLKDEIEEYEKLINIENLI